MNEQKPLTIPDEVLRKGCYSTYRVLKGLIWKKKKDKSPKKNGKKEQH